MQHAYVAAMWSRDVNVNHSSQRLNYLDNGKITSTESKL